MIKFCMYLKRVLWFIGHEFTVSRNLVKSDINQRSKHDLCFIIYIFSSMCSSIFYIEKICISWTKILGTRTVQCSDYTERMLFSICIIVFYQQNISLSKWRTSLLLSDLLTLWITFFCRHLEYLRSLSLSLSLSFSLPLC